MTLFPKKAREIITAPLPQELIFQKPGRAAADYISGSTVIDYLNHAFDYMWSYETLVQWVEPGVAKFNPKYDAEPVPQGPVAHVKGRLTVFLQDANGNPFKLVKEQYGSKAVIGGQMDQEHIFKAAGTDALKKCASLVGIGLELYRKESEQEHFDMINYEDPWTDEVVKANQEHFDEIRSFKTKFDLDDEGMKPYYLAFTENQFEDASFLHPDNIVQFATYLKEIGEQ